MTLRFATRGPSAERNGILIHATQGFRPGLPNAAPRSVPRAQNRRTQDVSRSGLDFGEVNGICPASTTCVLAAKAKTKAKTADHRFRECLATALTTATF